MTRRTMAERKRRASERDARRESLLVLLSRTRRGVALTPSEAALMFAHVEVELAEADELRRTVAGQQNAIQRTHDRTAAAEEAIREAEQRAADAEEQLGAYRAVEAFRKAQADTFEGRLDAMRQQTSEGLVTGFEQLQQRAKQAKRRGDTWKAKAQEIEADRDRGEATLQRVRDAGSLGAALAAVAEHDGLTPEAARANAAFVEAADSVEARLAEQAREHAIALATERRRGDGWKRHALTADARADRYWDAWRNARRRAQEHYTEQQRVRGWCAHWAARTRAAEPALAAERRRANRYRTAWFAARRDRKADRAAMAAELPIAQAGQQALALAAERCEPQNVNKDHPVIDLLNALKSSSPHPAPSALVRRYYEAIHTEACPRSHRAQLAEPATT